MTRPFPPLPQPKFFVITCLLSLPSDFSDNLESTLSCSWESTSPNCSVHPFSAPPSRLPSGAAVCLSMSTWEKQSPDLAPSPVPGRSPHSEVLVRVQA